MEAAVIERPARSRRVRSEANIHIRATVQLKQLIDTAANSVGKTLSEFMLDSAHKDAINVLLDKRLFVLDPDKYDAFVHALDNPRPPSENLKALMKRKPAWQK
ncbi:type II toxin-antitoxin system TacA family antitoxin [Bradyrhizobium elkanii]